MNARTDRGHQMRVPEKPLRGYPFYLRPFFWNQRRKYGEVLKAALLWARVPKLFAAVAVLYGVIDRHSSRIDPALRSELSTKTVEGANASGDASGRAANFEVFKHSLKLLEWLRAYAANSGERLLQRDDRNHNQSNREREP